jgi:carbon monoxide dehydrogenase subunit G
MASYHVHAEIEIAAPAEVVWARVSDHEATPSWIPQVKRVRLERDGEVHNGKGAIRVVAFRPRLWTAAREEIVRFEPPRLFEYVVRAGMPALRHHLGHVEVEPRGGGSRLRWDVDFTFGGIHPFRLFVPGVMRAFQGVLDEGMRELRRQLEASK